jgi:uncharacterized membrane protein
LRIVELGIGTEVTPDNARFFGAPWPVTLHILSSVAFCLLGAFQFAPGLRRSKPDRHRAAGWLLVPCGLAAAMSGLWMTLFYIAIAFDGPFVSAMRLAAGSAMALSLCLGVGFIRKGNILQHQAWMLRAYALGIGAGTQVVTHLPWFLFPGIQGELARTLSMGAGWAVNIAVAELLISRTLRGQVS